MNKPKYPLLNIGCGNHVVPGWENVDFVSARGEVRRHNLLKGIPYPGESFEAVYHSHVLEHFSKPDGERLIRECFRVLRPSGIIRVVVPDLEQMARVYLAELDKALAGDEQAGRNRDWMTIEFVDQASRHQSGGAMIRYLQRPEIPNWEFVRSRLGHEVQRIRADHLRTHAGRSTLLAQLKTLARIILRRDWLRSRAAKIGRFRLSGEVHLWMYDRFSLHQLLSSAGFSNVAVVDAHTSRIPDWEHHCQLDVSDGVTRKPESLFIEAQKPSR